MTCNCLFSASAHDCDNYQLTSNAEEYEEEEDVVPPKRKNKKRRYEGFVQGL